MFLFRLLLLVFFVVLWYYFVGTSALKQSRAESYEKIAKVFRMLWRWLQLSADVHKWPQSCPGRRPLSLVPSVQCSLQSTVSRVLSRGSCSSLGCWLPINLLLLAVAVQRKQMITLRVRNLSNQSCQGWRKTSTEILAEICFLINATFLVCCIRRPGVAQQWPPSS